MNALVDLLFLIVGIALGAYVMHLRRRDETSAAQSAAREAGERVGLLVGPIAERLGEFDRVVREMENKRNADSGALRQQLELLLGRADKIETAANALSNQTSTLVTALKSPTTRGKWGEIQLRNVVEKAGMLSYCDFDEQQTVAFEGGRGRPDMTINLPGERRVFVDAKAPIDALQAALEAVEDDARRDLVKRHARALQDHVDALAKRNYQSAEGSADFVVMFVPGEAFLSAACTENPMLIEYALDRNVMIAGPLSLISLLRSFAMGWQALKQEENAKRIAALGRELYERTARFAEKIVNLGKHMERSIEAYNQVVGTYESRLLPQGRKLKDEAAITGEELPEPSVIDTTPRSVTALDTEPRDPRSRRKPAEPNLFQNDQAG